MTGPAPTASEPQSPMSGFVRKYISRIFPLVAVVVLAMFWGFHAKATSMLRDQLLWQARAFYADIVLNRDWIADHGGVYVRMRPGMTSNPWLLKMPGLKVTIRDESGETYTLKNPALVTREISELAEQRGVLQFHITSDRPLNPENAPDPFERSSLARFTKGDRESSCYEERSGKSYFRYMAPLPVRESCLRCHGSQGYRLGDVRGGISVTIEATELDRQVRRYRVYLGLSALLILGAIYGIIKGISRVFLREIGVAEARLVDMATRDSLTGLLTRREMLRLAERERDKAVRSGRPLSAILVDIDRFKHINDSRGHGVGDLAIQALARTMGSTLRSYDVICRYGGEEFLAITPEMDRDQAFLSAERLRQALESQEIAVDGGEPVRLTVSAGVARLAEGESIESLISRADAALYAAKQAGRNRVHAG
jgi:diguanylate cyclase (GGDEF)-like protein